MLGGSEIYVGGISSDIKLDISSTESAITRVRDRIRAIESDMVELERQFQANSISSDQFAASIQDLTRSQQQMIQFEQELIDKLQMLNVRTELTAQSTQKLARATREAGAAADQGGRRSGALARGMMQLGYVADDLQYGFGGIVNNISPLVYSFSTAAGASTAMASGIASAAQLIAVAGYQAYVHWDDLVDLMGQGIPTPAVEGVEGLKNELKAIEKVIDDLHSKKRLNLVDLENLKEQENRAKILKEQLKDEKDLEDLKGQTKEEKARGSAFADAVKTQGGDRVEELLKGHFAEKADEEGQTLERDQLRDLIKGQSLDLSKDLTPEQVENLGNALGVKFDFAAMQQRKDNSGGDLPGIVGSALGLSDKAGFANAQDNTDSINNQILEQLGKQKFLYDESGNARTVEGMTKDTLLRGARGDKSAAELVAEVTNKGEGDPDGFTMSKFSASYLDASPEGKEAAKREKEKQQAEDKENKKNAADAKKEAKKTDDELDAAQQAFDDSNASWRKYRERRNKWVKEQVDALKDGDLGQAAIAGDLTEDMVKERLMKMGLDEEKVNSAYEDVFSQLELAGGKKIATRVGKTGEDHDVAAANLAKEYQEEQRKENADLAAKMIPGLDKAIEQRLTVGAAMTGNGTGVAAGVTEQIRQLLINAGVDPKAAANQASAAVEEGGEKVSKKVAEEAMDQQDNAKQSRKVDVFDSASLASKLQSSVGDSVQKEQVDELKKAVGFLAKMANQTGATVTFKK